MVVADSLSVRETEKLLKKKVSTPSARSETNKLLNKKLDQFKDKLEQKTGYHFKLSTNKSGGGQFSIKFSNEAEFNDIYEFLLSKR